MSDFDREDLELAEMMGNQFIDATKGEEPAEMPVYEKPVKKPHAMDIPVEAQWEPAKPAPSAMDKLKAFTQDVAVYAVASTVLFYWQQTGKMDYTTAWYALLVSAGMVFFSIGRHWGRK